ncbi:MAG: alpha-amylase [Gammaproteobacteria bacterium]|nr:alpha-amylase [Gammaproteobacteria bacterium]
MSGSIADSSEELTDYLSRAPEDDVIYFMLPDRFANGDLTNDTGGFGGDKFQHGFDPTHRGFYHGGDLKGLTAKLDYIKGLGATAIWLGPIYKNKPVQGPPGQQTSGYHGYWITDFTDVDPHLGTRADLKEFVNQAHARDIKVYLDIITNHTADVIKMRECHNPEISRDEWQWDCPYLTKADYPYSTQGDVNGLEINPGFLGDADEHQTAENFSKLVNANTAYRPYIPNGEENSKTPAWLNDPIYYHNRGDSDWWGESSLYGDFSGLDDLMTEHPRVVDGFIEIFKYWITEYRMDGFRIDTAKHVNANFWRQFLPAMQAHAASEGIPNFYMFGEVYDQNPAGLAKTTRVDGFEQSLDFAFQDTVEKVMTEESGTEIFDYFLMNDTLYNNGSATARRLPVFLGNHDMGRFAGKLKAANPDISQSELLERTKVAHAIMMFLRGVPVIYSGSEQGFVSDGGDQLAREDMFHSMVAEYNDNNLIGTDKTTADENYDSDHPLYLTIAQLSEIRKAHPALSRGELKLRLSQRDGRVLGFSRFDPDNDKEYVVVINTGATTESVNVEIEYTSTRFETILGSCPAMVRANGVLSVELGAFGVNVCKAQ